MLDILYHEKDTRLEHLDALMLGEVRVDGVAQNRKRRSFADFEPVGWVVYGVGLGIVEAVGLSAAGGR